MNTSKISYIKNTYYLVNILYSLSISIFGATIYLYMESINYNNTQINLFLAVFWLVSFLTEIPSGIIADSFGRKNTLIASCIIRGIGLLLLYIDWGNILLLVTGAVLTAIGESLKSGTVDSWMVDSIIEIDNNYKFEKVFSVGSVYGTFFSLISGFIGGQLIGPIDLGYPILLGSIILFITTIVVIIMMKETRPKGVHNQFSVRDSLGTLKNTTKFGIQYLKEDKAFLLICLSFLPLALIVTGPGNQWQLLFHVEGQSVGVGYIWVLMSLCGMVGAYLSKKISSLSNNKISILMISTLVNTSTIIICVLSNNYLLSLVFFLFHVIVTASEEIIRYTFLHQNIATENRATVLSFFNTLEAGVTSLALLIIGGLSDVIGIGNTWLVMAVLSIVISLPLFIVVNKVLLKIKSEQRI
ncbi:hypothetical protein BW897_24905 [Bacillus cereus]|uniref:Major facilitator superfamily (MFS) profile domain-containing protein n=1 Tax=Bacillus cereus TaxID=1396 RepID=A0A1S9TJE1_BACCE|nr:MFS transporter [Bacillus cereus]OOR10000.1 hypothetical protein BW897_24905 [Bacillus cereus]